MCLDVINQTWSPMFGAFALLLTRMAVSMSCGQDMINIFEVFLPQLLRYPNPNDPLNGEAAALMMRHPKEYEAKVKGKQTWSMSGSTKSRFLCRICTTIRNQGCS